MKALTMRERAHEAIVSQAAARAAYEHAQNYWKLRVFRNGEVTWGEFAGPNEGLLDEDYGAIFSVAAVGTGSRLCACDVCSGHVDADDRAFAIQRMIEQADLNFIKDYMLGWLEEVPTGYFDDEKGAAA